MLAKEILVLFVIAISLFSFLTILLSYLMVRKAIENRRRASVEAFKEKMVEAIFTYIYDGAISRDVRANTVVEKIAIEEVLSEFAKVLEGEQEKKNLQKLAEFHLANYYRRILGSRNWSQKMNALYHIEDFHMVGMKKDLLQMLERNISRDEAIHGLRILASFQMEGLYELLKEKFSDLSHFEYRNILDRLDEDEFSTFAISFHECPQELQCAILDVMGFKKQMDYLPYLEGVFFDYSGEVKLRALKAITLIGYVNDIEPYLSLCESPDWQFRMLAAKLIGQTKAEQGVSCLTSLLQDKSWWVRSQAGESIMKFSTGMDILKEVYHHSTDAFAKDMAYEWLNRRGSV